MRARMWLRVSSDDQDEEQQVGPCRRRIAYGDQGTPWTFDEATGIYRAHDVHGDDLEHPLRRKAFADAEAGLFDRLVIYELSRWTRGGILVVLQDRDRFARLGVKLVSVRQDWLENDLMLAVAAWMDGEKLETVRSETSKALQHRINQIEQKGGFWSKRSGKWRTRLGREKTVNIPDEAIELAIRLRADHSWREIARKVRMAGPKTVKGDPLWDFKHATIRHECQKRVPDLRRGTPRHLRSPVA